MDLDFLYVAVLSTSWRHWNYVGLCRWLSRLLFSIRYAQNETLAKQMPSYFEDLQDLSR